MSVITYNGITLPYPYHTNFSQECVYDDVSGEGSMGPTDKMYTKFDITVAAIINVNYLDAMGLEGADQTNPTSIMVKIRAALLQPRRELQVMVNNVPLITQIAQGNVGTVDAKNGPQPQSCDITQLTNETFLINYRIIAHYWENNTVDGNTITNNPGSPVLSNRWFESVEIDDLLLTTKVRRGKYTIRSDNSQGEVADYYRKFVAVTGVAKGFIRQKSKYTISPDGLSISYEIIDREVYKMPPDLTKLNGVDPGTPTAYRAQGTYTETTSPGPNSQFGWYRVGAVSLQLWGAKTTSQAALIAAALSIGNAKLLAAGGAESNLVGGSSVSKSIAATQKIQLTVDMYNNTVSVMMSALYRPRTKGSLKDKKAGQVGPRLNGWTFTPGSDNINNTGGTQPKQPIEGWGTAKYILKAAAYYDPSLNKAFLNNDDQFGNGLKVGEAGQKSEAYTQAEINAGVNH
ncbi:hypothetical protein C4577_07575 [Candidatus Parcubacteria bacterium]|nr:MAG: hypothetical protein C4577_07575 [Candidatus Parcubacteria bacterium]